MITNVPTVTRRFMTKIVSGIKKILQGKDKIKVEHIVCDKLLFEYDAIFCEKQNQQGTGVNICFWFRICITHVQ